MRIGLLYKVMIVQRFGKFDGLGLFSDRFCITFMMTFPKCCPIVLVCICVLCVFVTVFDVQLYGSECFFRRKTFAVKIMYLLGGFCFRTILISSNGNICYSLFTLSAVVVSRFASH